MRHLIDNILSLSPQNVASEVIVLCSGIWVLVWIAVLCDVFATSKTFLSKLVWILIVSIPMMGAILYALYNLFQADWSAAFFWRKSAKTKGKQLA